MQDKVSSLSHASFLVAAWVSLVPPCAMRREGPPSTAWEKVPTLVPCIALYGEYLRSRIRHISLLFTPTQVSFFSMHVVRMYPRTPVSPMHTRCWGSTCYAAWGVERKARMGGG